MLQEKQELDRQKSCDWSRTRLDNTKGKDLEIFRTDPNKGVFFPSAHWVPLQLSSVQDVLFSASAGSSVTCSLWLWLQLMSQQWTVPLLVYFENLVFIVRLVPLLMTKTASGLLELPSGKNSNYKSLECPPCFSTHLIHFLRPCKDATLLFDLISLTDWIQLILITRTLILMFFMNNLLTLILSMSVKSLRENILSLFCFTLLYKGISSLRHYSYYIEFCYSLPLTNLTWILKTLSKETNLKTASLSNPISNYTTASSPILTSSAQCSNTEEIVANIPTSNSLVALSSDYGLLSAYSL